MWSCSAIPGNESVILNGIYQGLTLSSLFAQRPDLFNVPGEVLFPLLVKIIATSAPLSVQVHPNDEYTQKNEGKIGKCECWLVLNCSLDANIVLGHNARDKTNLSNFVKKRNMTCF